LATNQISLSFSFGCLREEQPLPSYRSNRRSSNTYIKQENIKGEIIAHNKQGEKETFPLDISLSRLPSSNSVSDLLIFFRGWILVQTAARSASRQHSPSGFFLSFFFRLLSCFSLGSHAFFHLP
jgi:hypothetical protein